MRGEDDLRRKLATIMVADIVGFSRLAANDEDWTIRALGEFRAVVDEIIARHDGRIFNTGGDSVLAEFASPVEAVRCAVDFQEAARSRNLLQPRDRQLRFRIGINLGDVMVRGTDLLGDGVNVAARLEGLAEPGGICVSGTVWDQIQNKISVGYVDIGEQSVKNIPRPIRAYQLRLDGSVGEITGGVAPVSAPALVAAPPAKGGRRSALFGALAGAFAVAGIAIVAWQFWLRSEPPAITVTPAATPPAAIQPAPVIPPAALPTHAEATPTPAPVTPAPAPVTPAAAAPAAVPHATMRDCPHCPQMMVLPAGRFLMGADTAERARFRMPAVIAGFDQPQHPVTIAKPFALATHDITRGEFAAFVTATGYHPAAGCTTLVGRRWVENPTASWENPGYPQSENDPVVCVNLADMRAYLGWLLKVTGKPYRLPSEAEWEYAARAGTTTTYYWGDDPDKVCQYENVGDQTAHEKFPGVPAMACRDGFATTAPVGSFRPNPWGLYDMLGNIARMTADCWHPNYDGAPADGSAWSTGDCALHPTRGAPFEAGRPAEFRSAARRREGREIRRDRVGFRPALSLP